MRFTGNCATIGPGAVSDFSWVNRSDVWTDDERFSNVA